MKNRDRREAQGRGQIEIHKPVMLAFVKQFPRFKWATDDYRFRDEGKPLYLPVKRFTVEELARLQVLMEACDPKPRATIGQISMHVGLMKEPHGKPINTLIALETALIAYVKHNIIQGWVFVKGKNSEVFQPMLVDSVEYHPPVQHKDHRQPAYTEISCVYWSKGKTQNWSASWGANELGKNVDLLMADEGLIKETRERVNTFLKEEEKFLKWRQLLGTQFLGNGTFHGESNSSWSSKEHDSDMHNTRLVVDDRCDTIEPHRATKLFYDLDEDDDERDETEEQAAEAGFTRIPTEHFIWTFNLESHRAGFVHMSEMEKYVYHPEVRTKLILPPEHEDLIDALTADRDVLMEDIVSGKSGGTTIICQGKAGTGKTLTAEVYAEVIKTPLYRVHSGQLGIAADTVEAELKEAMNRAKRWNCILLIDEADVFIRSRGDSLEHNAIVGVFLRVLEYFDGLLFLTTNRGDEIDDAILSRCIARITFKEPGLEERKKLWASLGEVYQMKLVQQKGMVVKLAETFPTATGRDIKGLIRLAIKYSRQRKKVLAFEDIKRMSVFKGLA